MQDFRANIQSSDYSEFRLIKSKHSPCSGRHTAQHVALSSKIYYALLIVSEGRELLSIGEQPLIIEKDTAVLWDSTRIMEFCTETTLEKITLVIPQEKLQVYLKHPEQYVGSLISLQTGLGAVLKGYIASLIQYEQSLEHCVFLADKTLELVAACLESQRKSDPYTEYRRDRYRQIIRYIDRHLDDHDMTPDSIATEFSMSKRSLYLLFQEADDSVSHHIQNKRIERCKHDILRCNDETIITIAFRWGFRKPF